MAPATLYKARNVRTKQPVCAICVDRTRGRTERLDFGYGVAVWLCERHGAVEFLTRRGGGDIVATLQQLWTAHGCLTAARRKALESHLHSLRARSPRPLPGSYAWPAVRLRAEHAFALGRPTGTVVSDVLESAYGEATAPSVRTIRRWRTQRRWLARPPTPRVP
jgi:hypothetical protein